MPTCSIGAWDGGTFFAKDEDFLAFERVIEESLRTRRMRLRAYCLMSNHWHLVAWPERDGDLPAFMRHVTNMHVKRWKQHRHEIGHGCHCWLVPFTVLTPLQSESNPDGTVVDPSPNDPAVAAGWDGFVGHE